MLVHSDSAFDDERLASWLGEILGVSVDARTMVLKRPQGGGWSNDTVFVDPDGRGADRLVVRLAPTGPAMFPHYDLTRQWVVMQELAAATSVPVPPVLGVDADGTQLGRPGFVMGFVEGRVPADDRPSFAESGFLYEASPGQQRVFHTSLIDAIVAVHRTPLTDRLIPLLSSDHRSTNGALDELRRTWHFDRGERWSPVIDDALDVLRGSVPAPRADVLLWGDARPANVIVASDGYRPVALVDWELATIGPPELDVMWLAEMNRMRMEGSGVSPLPSFLDDVEAVSHYERRSGRSLGDLDWYRLFAAVRVAVLMHRHLRVMVHIGRLPADHRLLTDTNAVRRVAALLEATPVPH